MKINVFVYIAINLLLINLIGLESNQMNQVISVLCISGVLTVGLAHGAIDNVLMLGNNKSKNLQFILYYLLVAIGFIISWLIMPNLTFLCFILVSAYHFGQSQFVEYKIPHKFLSGLLYVTWGFLVLLLAFGFNQIELTEFSNGWLSNISVFPLLIKHAITASFIFLVLFAMILIYSFKKSYISLSKIFQESYLLALISISFYLFNTVVGFSLFFLFIHSLKVIQQEFKFCTTKLEVSNMLSFVKLFLPLTFASIFGIAAVLTVTYLTGYQQMIPYVLIIMLSSFTIPHSLVMDRFYS